MRVTRDGRVVGDVVEALGDDIGRSSLERVDDARDVGDDVERAEGAENEARDEDEEESDEDDDDDVDDAYVDNAARVFRFVAIGGDWASRLASVRFDADASTT